MQNPPINSHWRKAKGYYYEEICRENTKIKQSEEKAEDGRSYQVAKSTYKSKS